MNDDNFEVNANEYINKEIKTESLSKRIHYLLENSKAIVVRPGKIGTLTELIVAWNTNYLYNISKDKDVIPIFLKKDYWKEIIDNMPEDMELSNNFLEYYENVEDLEKFIEKLD
jgi:predicted Rossmann-fold nucleotide-binding protein